MELEYFYLSRPYRSHTTTHLASSPDSGIFLVHRDVYSDRKTIKQLPAIYNPRHTGLEHDALQNAVESVL